MLLEKMGWSGCSLAINNAGRTAIQMDANG